MARRQPAKVITIEVVRQKLQPPKTQTFLQVSKIGISRHKLAHFLGNLFYKLAHFLGESFRKLAHFLVKRLHSWYTIVNRKEMIL